MVLHLEQLQIKLNSEISENENRKEFTFSERVDWAKRLERIEKIKAKERQNLGQKSDEGRRTDDTVANNSGFGSRDTYNKAKYISDNADEEMIKKLDDGQLSINALYIKRKKTTLNHFKTQKRYITHPIPKTALNFATGLN